MVLGRFAILIVDFEELVSVWLMGHETKCVLVVYGEKTVQHKKTAATLDL